MPDPKAAKAAESRFRRPLLQGVFAVAATAAVAGPAPALAETFLRLGDIKGESTDQKHKDEIEILSFTQSWTNSVGSAGGGGGAGKLQCGAITLMKSIDRSSPLLLKAIARGEHIKDAVITFRSANGEIKSPEYYTITMDDVFVTELGQTDSADPNRIFEKLVLNAGAFEFKYTPTDLKGGLGTPVSFKWDCSSNKGG